jgi:hypothetical protein
MRPECVENERHGIVGSSWQPNGLAKVLIGTAGMGESKRVAIHRHLAIFGAHNHCEATLALSG